MTGSRGFPVAGLHGGTRRQRSGSGKLISRSSGAESTPDLPGLCLASERPQVGSASHGDLLTGLNDPPPSGQVTKRQGNSALALPLARQGASSNFSETAPSGKARLSDRL